MAPDKGELVLISAAVEILSFGSKLPVHPDWAAVVVNWDVVFVLEPEEQLLLTLQS
jgi:hypothetical protein